MTAEDNKLNQEVDAKKIAFIACVNDDKMWERCKEHIFACNCLTISAWKYWT